MSTASQRVFISYSHDSVDHRARVRQLGDSLKVQGLDVRLDTYEPEDPPEGWPLRFPLTACPSDPWDRD